MSNKILIVSTTNSDDIIHLKRDRILSSYQIFNLNSVKRSVCARVCFRRGTTIMSHTHVKSTFNNVRQHICTHIYTYITKRTLNHIAAHFEEVTRVHHKRTAYSCAHQMDDLFTYAQLYQMHFTLKIFFEYAHMHFI